MRNIIKILFGLVCGLSMISCSDRVNKFYEFEVVRKEIDGGELYIMLQGTYINKDSSEQKITLRSNPYMLVIGLFTNEDAIEEVRLSGVRFCEDVTSACRKLPNKADVVKSPANQYAYIMNVSWRDLEIDYVPHRVVAELEIVVGDQVRRYEISEIIKTKYSETESSDFWDRLGSV